MFKILFLLTSETFFLLVFQWLGLSIMAVGVWAWSEKDTFNNLSHLTNVALDPAFILILVGKIRLLVIHTYYHLSTGCSVQIVSS